MFIYPNSKKDAIICLLWKQGWRLEWTFR